ncbi:MAG TPA: hypothetical protein VLA03_05865, partial [Draconibacterium sp.]|nr:hypothetical protein [Draconibacterium sp.]
LEIRSIALNGYLFLQSTKQMREYYLFYVLHVKLQYIILFKLLINSYIGKNTYYVNINRKKS